MKEVKMDCDDENKKRSVKAIMIMVMLKI